jgi:hypothetical protein
MAGKGPTVTLTFAGDAKKLEATISRVDKSSARLTKTFKGLGGGLSLLTKAAAGGGAIKAIGGVAGAVTQLSGAALLLPGAALAGAAALGTLKLATSGFGDALGDIRDPEKFAEAIKGWAPAARDTANAIKDSLPQFDQLKSKVQGNFFAGMSMDVKDLAKTYFPVLTDGMGKVATGYNRIIRGATAALQSSRAIGTVKSVFTGLDLMLSNMRNSLANVTLGILDIAGVGVKSLPNLGIAIDKATIKFRDWAREGAKSGDFAATIQTAKAGFADLFAIIGNLGGAAAYIFKGLGGSTESALAPLRTLSQTLEDAVARPEVQEALGALGRLLTAAAETVQSILIPALKTLAPVFTPIVDTITAAMPSISQAFSDALTMVSPFVTAFADLVAWLSPAINLLIQMSPILVPLVAVIGVITGALKLWAMAQAALNFLMTANPIGLVVMTLALLVGIFILCYKHSETFRNGVNAAFEMIKAGARAFVDFFGNRMQAFLALVRGIPMLVSGIFGGFGGLLMGSGRALIEGLWAGIKGAFGWLKDNVAGLLKGLRNLFPFSPAKEGPFSGKGYTTYSGQALMQDFGKGMEQGAPDIRGAALAALSGAQLALSGPVAGGAGSGSGSGTGGAIELRIGPGADSALVAVLHSLQRAGQLQFVRA